MTTFRWMGAWIVVAFVAGLVGLLIGGRDDDGRFDARDAESCGESLARSIGLTPTAASARLEDDVWRISVATTTGALALIVRPDGQVLEAQEIGPGGSAPLERADRLAIFERGC